MVNIIVKKDNKAGYAFVQAYVVINESQLYEPAVTPGISATPHLPNLVSNGKNTQLQSSRWNFTHQ